MCLFRIPCFRLRLLRRLRSNIPPFENEDVLQRDGHEASEARAELVDHLPHSPCSSSAYSPRHSHERVMTSRGSPRTHSSDSQKYQKRTICVLALVNPVCTLRVMLARYNPALYLATSEYTASWRTPRQSTPRRQTSRRATPR